MTDVRSERMSEYLYEGSLRSPDELKAIADHRKRKVAELEAGYREAIEDIEDWGAYASDYFQQKHDLSGCIAAHKALLEKDGAID